MKTLSVIVPIYNEEKTLADALDAVLRVDLSAQGYKKEIILVNDGSKDRSDEIVQRYLHKEHANATIQYIACPKNKGKGHALKTGFAQATGDVLLIQDADMEYDPRDYVPLLKKLEESGADMVYGSRIRGIPVFKNSYSTVSFLVGGLTVSLLTSLLSWTLVTDEPTCYKMFRGHLKSYLVIPEENEFEWEPAITMLLLRKGCKYVELPIHYAARKVTDGKKIKRKDGLKALSTLVVWKFKNLNV